MEEGCKKSTRLSYMAKFKREFIWCERRRKTTKPLQFLELRRHKGNSLDPRKDDFLKLICSLQVFSRKTQDLTVCEL
jgi:hypothetical protein